METQHKTSPKDVFLHLLAIVALYFSAGSFITLIFQLVNVWIPDLVAEHFYNLQGIYQAIRWSISVLVVVFPVYILTSWFLNKGYLANPSKRNLWIRKWLIYFTLFVSAIIIIGDLVFLMNNLLGGELTIRFLLKVLTVLFVASSVFSYYFWDLRRHKVE